MNIPKSVFSLIPKPTKDNPYIQIDWLCNQFVKKYDNEYTKKAYVRAVSAYKAFLKNSNGYDSRLVENPEYLLNLHCDHFVLHNVFKYWQEECNHASGTIARRIDLLRNLFKYGAENKLTYALDFIDPKVGKVRRETSMRASYNDKDLQFIWKIIAPAYDYAKKISGGYKKTGIGSDPRLKPLQQKYKLDSKTRKRAVSPWSEWNNIVWYFENELSCIPLSESKELRPKHGPFFSALKYFGGQSETFKRLGVTNLISIRLLGPLAMKLCLETGLNSEALLRLKRDCFQESHPLTGLPYIRYYKARSTGEKDLHLHLFDTSDLTELPLSPKHSGIIKKTLQTIIKLTEPLVDKANIEDRDYVFLYQADVPIKNKKRGDHVLLLDPGKFNRWTFSLLRRHRKNDTENVPELMNLGRFRPTKLLQMLREGKDLFDIQAVAGHADSVTLP